MIIENDSLEVLRTCEYVKNDKLGAMVSNNLYLSIVATNSCQCNCPYCINSLTNKTLHLPLEKAKVNIKKSVDGFGIKEAVILGGEPTLYPYLSDLIKFLKDDCGLRKVGFTTNGIKLKDVAYLDGIVGTGVDFINISYHNHGEFLHPTDMWSIYTRFCDIKQPHQKIRINTNVWKGNHDNIESLLEFIGQISVFCDEMRISNIIRKDNFSVNPDAVDEAESMYMTDKEYEVLFNKLLDAYRPKYSIIHNPAALGFVNYYLIPTKVPIILNWNIDSKVSEQVCENNLGDNKIHTIKCLVTGDMSLSWNVNNIIKLKEMKHNMETLDNIMAKGTTKFKNLSELPDEVREKIYSLRLSSDMETPFDEYMEQFDNIVVENCMYHSDTLYAQLIVKEYKLAEVEHRELSAMALPMVVIKNGIVIKNRFGKKETPKTKNK